ncbi:hypothetical protein AAG747_14510 [Rapidithrix thailandica]|uniref:Uncharacterized protein n=1 Tax=Rapidithrix thailandica TaxID=413964 RepID=A0AAW9RW60_9BACT
MKTITGLAFFLVMSLVSISFAQITGHPEVTGIVAIVLVFGFFALTVKWLLSFKPPVPEESAWDLTELMATQTEAWDGTQFVGKVVRDENQKGTYLLLEHPTSDTSEEEEEAARRAKLMKIVTGLIALSFCLSLLMI